MGGVALQKSALYFKQYTIHTMQFSCHHVNKLVTIQSAVPKYPYISTYNFNVAQSLLLATRYNVKSWCNTIIQRFVLQYP